jgi:hypothetical protein
MYNNFAAAVRLMVDFVYRDKNDCELVFKKFLISTPLFITQNGFWKKLMS